MAKDITKYEKIIIDAAIPLFRLELLGEIDIMDNVHSVDDWVSQLLNNCQSTGVTLNRAAAEITMSLFVGK